MANPAAVNEPGPVRGFLRRWRWPLAGLLGLVLYALAGYVLAPWLIARELPKIARETLGREASVAAVEVDPFAFTLRLTGLRLKDTDGSLLAGLDEMYVDLAAGASIVGRALTLAELRLDAPYLNVMRGRDGAINLLHLVPSGPAPAAEAPDAPPRLVVRALRLSRGALDFTDALPADVFHTRVGPFDVALDEISTLPDATGRHQLAITLESGTRITVAGDLVINPLRASGEIGVQGPFLGLLHRYLRDQFQFDLAGGTTDIGLRFDLRGTPDGGVEAGISDLTAAFRDVRLSAPSAGEFLGWSELRIAGGALRWPANEVSAQAVTLGGLILRARLGAGGRIDLEDLLAPAEAAAGTPPAAPADIAPVAPASGSDWAVRIGEVSLADAALELTDAARPQPVQLTVADLDVALREVTTEPGARLPLEAAARLGAGGDIRLAGTVALLPEFSLDGELKAEGIALAQAQPYVSDIARIAIRGGTLALDGHLASGTGESLAFEGDLRVRDLDTEDMIKRERLLAWRELALDDLEFQLDGNRARVTRVRLERPFGRIYIARDQSTNIGDLFVEAPPAAAGAAEATPPATPAPAGEPFRARVGTVRVRNGEVDFTDLSLPLPFAARIEDLKGEVTTIDTRSTAPSRLAFEGRVDRYGLAQVGGEVRISSPTDLADVTVLFRNIEMAPLSPYTVKFAGRKIARGRINLDLRYQLADRQMVGTNKIVIDELELGEKVPHPDAVDLPLGLAVALLKDANGRIDVDMPVSGSLDDPQFGIGSVLWKAFINLVTRVATAPFRLLGSLLGMESEDLGRIDFPPGRADLLPPEQEKLLRVAEALARRPELVVEVPAAFDPQADAAVLRTAKAQALIDQDLAASGAPESGRGLEKRTRRAIESLYETTFPDRDLGELQAGFQAPPADDPQGRPRLDELAYLDRLRADLAAAQVVTGEELAALGTARAEAIATALTTVGQVPIGRVKSGDSRQVTVRDGAWISAELGLAGAH